MTLLVGSIFHMTRKIVSEMTYNVSMGTLNPTIPYHTPAQWLRWPPLARKPSMLHCRLITFSSWSQWKHWVPSMSLRAHFWTIWAGEFLFWAAMTESICFYFNAFLLPFGVLTPYCCTTVCPLRTTRTSFSTSNLFVLFLIFSHPRFYEGKKKIIIIMCTI